MSEGYNLQRFVEAQRYHYPSVLKELRSGQKQNHWMWYIFPQLQGLGHSAMARKYAIAYLAEAKAYLKHPLLGSRLRECTQLVLDVKQRSIEQIFPYPDHLKFCSCMTLFDLATANNELYRKALNTFFAGVPDQRTIELLNNAPRRT